MPEMAFNSPSLTVQSEKLSCASRDVLFHCNMHRNSIDNQNNPWKSVILFIECLENEMMWNFECHVQMLRRCKKSRRLAMSLSNILSFFGKKIKRNCKKSSGWMDTVFSPIFYPAPLKQQRQKAMPCSCIRTHVSEMWPNHLRQFIPPISARGCFS